MLTAANNNPQVVSALFNDAAAKDAVDVAFAQLMPQVSFQGQVLDSNNALLRAYGKQRLPGGRAALGAGLSGRRRVFRECARRGRELSRRQSWWTMRAAPRCRMRCRRGKR